MLLFLGALVAGLLLIHPYVTYPASLSAARRRPLQISSSSPRTSATLVFSAYNESATIVDKIKNCRDIKALLPELEFKAYVDFSSDCTLDLLRQHGGDFIDVHAATERTGKALGMRRLVAAATTDIVIFTDANVMVEPASIPTLLGYFSDPAIGGVSGTLVYVNPDESATASVNSFYWRLEERLKQLESRTGSLMGADGSLFATRRGLYPVVPGHLLDDFIVSMTVVLTGNRMVSAPDVIAYERSAAASADEFRRKRRIACRAHSSHRYLRPQLARLPLFERYKYLSHRVIRWYGAVWAALAALLGLLWIGRIAGTVPAIVVALAIILIGFAALTSRNRLLRRVGELERALAATILGVADSWRGRTYQTWQPAQTR